MNRCWTSSDQKATSTMQCRLSDRLKGCCVRCEELPW